MSFSWFLYFSDVYKLIFLIFFGESRKNVKLWYLIRIDILRWPVRFGSFLRCFLSFSWFLYFSDVYELNFLIFFVQSRKIVKYLYFIRIDILWWLVQFGNFLRCFYDFFVIIFQTFTNQNFWYFSGRHEKMWNFSISFISKF